MKSWMVFWFAILMSALAVADDAKLAPELKQTANDQMVSVIVQYKAAPSVLSRNKIQMSGGTVLGDLALVKGVTATVPLSKLPQLSNDDAVAYISPNRAVRGHLNNVVPAVLANYGWGLGLDGTGVGVAVIDSGIYQVNDLQSSGASRIAYSADFVGGGTDDQYGHGTHVAGIIGGNGSYSHCPTCTVSIRGLAPNVTLINLRVLDICFHRDPRIASSILHDRRRQQKPESPRSSPTSATMAEIAAPSPRNSGRARRSPIPGSRRSSPADALGCESPSPQGFAGHGGRTMSSGLAESSSETCFPIA